ncbi:abc transporter atp-binding protein [Moniliophthora roreri]|uniref:ABC transporter domain-containing protein n=1 Tax=Moniliophthora roreri TaxID=221103 RepID=A0A0W0G7E8_MONRR|nr:abc transporter atp-binding protein [Moniliophthora roreri]
MGQPTEKAVDPKPIEDSAKNPEKPKISKPLETLHLGVYRVIFEKKSSWRDSFRIDNIPEIKERITKSWKLIERLLREIVSLGPLLFVLLIAVKVWEDVQDVILLMFETRVLQVLETGLRHQAVDARGLIQALILQALCVSASSVIARWCRRIGPKLEDKVKHYYQDVLLNTKLNMDLPTLQNNISQDHISAALPWETFENVLKLFAKAVAVVGQMSFVLRLARRQGTTFALICLARPTLSMVSQDEIWTRPRVVETVNQDYIRMRSLHDLENKKYRHDIISGNIVQYIIDQFQKARTALGDISTDYPERQYREQKFSLTMDILTELSGILPMVYYAMIALLHPSQTSLTMIATLQQSSIFLRWSFYEIYYELDYLRRNLSSLQEFYDLQAMVKVTVVKDGTLSYPGEKSSPKGMSFELRNVTFSYPENKNDDSDDSDPDSDKTPKKALGGVSFRIEAGQLVVIVGQNGSGKSTFINLLTRMYEASSGEILVDGEDISRFKIADFRQAIATLTQEHNLFPLSIAENIGLGCPEAGMNKDMITEAAQKGGADALIKKLGSGSDTVLDPMTIQYHAHVDEKDESELAGHLKRMKKTTDVSGGERQRLVAARTFMRFNSNRIRFVAVDEPSSALDPEGEVELFNNLRAARAGKTMLFVTHRFGPLTKHADRIICMKDGHVVESGTHLELMAKGAEYFKMYNIQAKAFETPKDD